MVVPGTTSTTFSFATAKKDSNLTRTDDEAELLLQVAIEYKTAKAMESIDWESVQKRTVILLTSVSQWHHAI